MRKECKASKQEEHLNQDKSQKPHPVEGGGTNLTENRSMQGGMRGECVWKLASLKKMCGNEQRGERYDTKSHDDIAMFSAGIWHQYLRQATPCDLQLATCDLHPDERGRSYTRNMAF